jgi:hypothetical protein
VIIGVLGLAAIGGSGSARGDCSSLVASPRFEPAAVVLDVFAAGMGEVVVKPSGAGRLRVCETRAARTREGARGFAPWRRRVAQGVSG